MTASLESRVDALEVLTRALTHHALDPSATSIFEVQHARLFPQSQNYPATETKHSVTPGWYVLQDSNGKDPCLVKVYVPRSHETLADQSLHVGFGVWDGGAFVPLSDIKDDSIFISVRIINARSGKDYSDAFER